MFKPDIEDQKKVRRELMFQIIKWTFFYAPPLCLGVDMGANRLIHQDMTGLLEALYAGAVTLCGTVIGFYFHGANRDGQE